MNSLTRSCSKNEAPDVAGNASFAMFAKAFYLASRLLVPPMVLAHVSLVEYGLWSACFVLIMYIGLTDVGFSNVYVRYTARYHAQGDTAAINRLLSTGVVTLSFMAVLVLAGLWLALPHVLDFLKVEPGHRDMAAILVMGAAAMFLLDLSLGAYCYLLHGLQRIKEEQRVAVLGYVLELVLIFGFLQAGMGIYSLLAAFVLRYAWSLTAFMRLAHRHLPGLEIRPRHFDREALGHFFGFGLAVQASALLGTALFSLDRVLAGFLLGPKGIALFELGAKLPVAAISVPSTISNVTMPAAARLSAEDDHAGIRTLYRQASRAIGILAAFPLAFMAVFANPIALTWLGDSEAIHALPLILALSALWSHLHIVTGPGSAVFRAMGQVGNEFVYHGLRIGCLALAIGASLMHLGTTLVALAIGLAIGSAAAALAYLVWNQRRLGMPLRQLFAEILMPGLLAYPVAGTLALAWQALLPAALGRWEGLAALLAFGCAYSAAYAGVCWRWLLQPEERTRVREIAGRMFGGLLKWRST